MLSRNQRRDSKWSLIALRPSSSLMAISFLQATAKFLKQVSASIPAMVSLFRQLIGKMRTRKDSSGTPRNLNSRSRSNQGRKREPQDRWHGFTDVFSTRVTTFTRGTHATTLVSSNPRSFANSSNDELELLEDPVSLELGLQSRGHDGHLDSLD